MDLADEEHLRVIIAVALNVVPKRIQRAYFDRCDEQHDEARRHLSKVVAKAVVQQFELRRRTTGWTG